MIYSSLGGANELHKLAKNDHLFYFYYAIAKACKSRLLTPRKISLVMGLTEHLLELILREYRTSYSSLYIYTNKKRMTLGFNKHKRMEIPLSTNKNFKFLELSEKPNNLIIGSILDTHIIIANKDSAYYPSFLREFSHLNTALILVYHNNFPTYTTSMQSVNAFEYITATMNHPNGHIIRLKIMMDYILKNFSLNNNKTKYISSKRKKEIKN
nr:GSCFA domain-containing protein [Oedogonium sp. 210]